MIALDFKLTSGQVRRLLEVWFSQDRKLKFKDVRPPVLELFTARDFVTPSEALKRKGLLTYVEYPWMPGYEGVMRNYDVDGCGPQLTKAGLGVVEVLLEQARHITALADAREAWNAAKPKARGKKAVQPTTEGL